MLIIKFQKKKNDNLLKQWKFTIKKTSKLSIVFSRGECPLYGQSGDNIFKLIYSAMKCWSSLATMKVPEDGIHRFLHTGKRTTKMELLQEAGERGGVRCTYTSHVCHTHVCHSYICHSHVCHSYVCHNHTCQSCTPVMYASHVCHSHVCYSHLGNSFI